MAGWIKLYRDIENNWLWNEKPFSRGQAFIDLVLMVNHEDRKIMFNGTLIEIKRGTCITSIRKLSEKWGWSKNKTKHFLEQLKVDKMADYKSDTKKTVVTIENYSVYQSRDLEKGHQSDTEETLKGNKREADGKQKDTNKNDKEYIKNYKEREEGKEEQPSTLPSLSFPSKIYEDVFNEVGDTAYRTWFINSKIEVVNSEVVIKLNEDFKKGIVKDKYSMKLQLALNKNIRVECESDE